MITCHQQTYSSISPAILSLCSILGQAQRLPLNALDAAYSQVLTNIVYSFARH